jgi:hypothetical protein
MEGSSFTKITAPAFQNTKDPSLRYTLMSNLKHISPFGARLDRGAAMHAERAIVRTA